jgi:cystathionine beta-lyase family protein involved in aluminum resistance
VPSFFLVFKELPLLGSGKIDIAALKKDAVERIRVLQKESKD